MELAKSKAEEGGGAGIRGEIAAHKRRKAALEKQAEGVQEALDRAEEAAREQRDKLAAIKGRLGGGLSCYH